MTQRALVSLVSLCMCVPGAALAQATGEEPGKVQQIRAVERGLFVEMAAGLNLPITKVADRSYGAGLLIGALAGYDILPVLSVSLGVYGTAATHTLEQLNPPAGTMALRKSGDLLYILPMLEVQFALLTTERNFVYVRGGVGFGIATPDELDVDFDLMKDEYGGSGVVFSAGAGVEHYTKLRHFSVGARVGILGVTAPDFGLNITLLPTVKYTF